MKKRLGYLLGTLPVVLLVWTAGNQPALACAVCYGDADGPMIKAAGMGVWLMIGLVVALQSSFALFFIHLWRRTRKPAKESPTS
jgi:hypothetical protein